MIVENKEITLEAANKISSKIISIIQEEAKDFGDSDDPAEQIYLASHILGSLIAKVAISLKNYGDMYSISSLTTTSIIEWIIAIANENIKINEGKIK